jgi:hypothetical protein
VAADPRLRRFAEEVAALDPDELTPRQALELIATLSARARDAMR